MIMSLMLMSNLLRSEGFPSMSLRNFTYKCTKHCHTSIIVWQSCVFVILVWEANSKVTAFDLFFKVPGLILAQDANNPEIFHSSSKQMLGWYCKRCHGPSLHIISISLIFCSTLQVFSYLHNY